MTACLKPLHIPDQDTGRIRVVPCGRCNACLVRARQEWSLRLREEQKVSKDAWFVTLTYDNDHLPITEYVEPDTGACFYHGTVCKDDVQKFNKRFRKLLATKYNCKTRFYLISEYGPDTLRPHYHGIYFLDAILDQDSMHSALCSAWSFCVPERITVDVVTEERINYVTEYCLTRKGIPDYLEPNFRLMSNRPGLGASYVDRMKKWHLADVERFYSPGRNATEKVSLSRYYRQKIYSPEVLDERSARLEYEALQKEIEISQLPPALKEKYFLDFETWKKDYINRTNRFLEKKSKHKQI